MVITAEEHQLGALAWRVSAVITETPLLYDVPIITGAIGVKDRFGDSGAPWELIKEFEFSAEHIAQKALELMEIKGAGLGVEQQLIADCRTDSWMCAGKRSDEITLRLCLLLYF